MWTDRSSGSGPQRTRPVRPRDDQGSATVWMVMVMCLLLVTGGSALALGQVVAARHRAGAAADLAALAAADHALDGVEAACARASAVARAQRAHLVACGLDGDVADVLVEVRSAVTVMAMPPAQARARAGPGPEEP